MTIGLFGFYNHGNFGDDLMALLFAKALKAGGHRVLTVGCRPALAEEGGLEMATSIEEMVKVADAIVYGGGGILVPHAMSESAYSRYRNDVRELVEKAKEAGKPLAAYSIGGTGAAHASLPEAIQHLVRSGNLDSCTLRLRGDQAHFTSEAPLPPVFPDVVLQTSSIFPKPSLATSGEGRKCVIGVNIGRRPVDARLCTTLRLVQKCCRSVELKFFDTFTRESPVRTTEMSSSDGSENVRYTSVEGHLDELARLDLLFTHKLHLGVAALSYGVPSVSWAGPAKARNFFLEAGAGGGVSGGTRKSALSLFLKMVATGGRCPASYKPDTSKLSRIREESALHFKEMNRWLDTVGSMRSR